MAQVTIKTLAKMLDLHPSTVSKALRDKPDIGSKTKQRVLALANKLDYRPNIVATSLKDQRARHIGILVPEIKHSFFASAIDAIDKVAQENEFAIILTQSGEKLKNEVHNVNVLEQHRVAGIIASVSQETIYGDHFKGYQRRGGMLVFFDRACDNIIASKVVNDNLQGAFRATEHLIEVGYQRIGHIMGPQDVLIARERYQGFTEALIKHGRSVNKEYISSGGLHESNGYDGMIRLLALPDPPDAVFCVNDPTAIGACQAIKKKGLHVGADIGVVGFSNNPVTEYVDPALTTVDQFPSELGSRAAEILVMQLKAQRSGEEIAIATTTVKTRLIIRESTARYRSPAEAGA